MCPLAVIIDSKIKSTFTTKHYFRISDALRNICVLNIHLQNQTNLSENLMFLQFKDYARFLCSMWFPQFYI